MDLIRKPNGSSLWLIPDRNNSLPRIETTAAARLLDINDLDIGVGLKPAVNLVFKHLFGLWFCREVGLAWFRVSGRICILMLSLE